MITFLNITNSDRVLATLGLSVDDLALSPLECDTVMQNKDLERLLQVDLFNWLPTYTAVFIPDTALSAATATQQYQSNLLTLFCTYFCAAKTAEAVLAIYSKETDGESEYDRPKVDLTALASQMMTYATTYKNELIRSLNSTIYIPVVAILNVVAPLTDPVTQTS